MATKSNHRIKRQENRKLLKEQLEQQDKDLEEYQAVENQLILKAKNNGGKLTEEDAERMIQAMITLNTNSKQIDNTLRALNITPPVDEPEFQTLMEEGIKNAKHNGLKVVPDQKKN